MKVAVIAIIALLMLGGAGAGGYFYFKQPAEAASGASGEHAEGAKDKHQKGDHGPASIFVQLDPVILPIIGKDGVTQTVSLVIAIETGDEAGKAEILRLAPRLKDAFIQDMYGMLNQEVMVRGGVIQVTALKSRLQQISYRVLGKEQTKDVLLQVVQQRPL